MSKPICFRVNTTERESIESAAHRNNQSITAFVKSAALKAAEKESKKVIPATRLQHRGVPSFVRALVFQASQGGAYGYDTVAYELCRHLWSQSPDNAEDDEWQSELDTLEDLVESNDESQILAWFIGHYPRIMELVPDRRRTQFVEGVFRAVEDGIFSEN